MLQSAIHLLTIWRAFYVIHLGLVFIVQPVGLLWNLQDYNNSSEGDSSLSISYVPSTRNVWLIQSDFQSITEGVSVFQSVFTLYHQITALSSICRES